ncbi:hypothetical protein PLESTM_000643200 [Pleodorina starrii]|nr:hypothetical protein PLESTM_000643200 [Pleodorina starrii]
MTENVFGRWLDTTFGFRGRHNILSWAVAGGLAYYFFVLPEQRKQEEWKRYHDEKVRLYEEQRALTADKSKQQNGLVVGSGTQALASSGETQTEPAAAK